MSVRLRTIEVRASFLLACLAPHEAEDGADFISRGPNGAFVCCLAGYLCSLPSMYPVVFLVEEERVQAGCSCGFGDWAAEFGMYGSRHGLVVGFAEGGVGWEGVV